jgi:tight adherence protein C
MENAFLIFVLILISVSLLMFGLYLSAQSYKGKRDFKKRLEGIEDKIIIEEAFEKEGVSSGKGHFLSFLGSLGKFLHPKDEGNISEMRRLFIKAGYRSGKALPLFFGLKVLLGLLLFGATLLGKLFFWEKMSPASFTYLSIILAIAGFYLPNLWIKLRISSRKDKIQRGLPDALDLMVVCVEAGTGLDAALNRTAEEMKKTNSVLAEELGLVNLEIRAGKTRQDALKNLAWRTDLEDISNLTTLLIQTERFGTSIAQALRVHSDFMRTKRFQRAEELAQKMPIKLLFPLVLFILPMFFLITLGPAMSIFFKYFGSK